MVIGDTIIGDEVEETTTGFHARLEQEIKAKGLTKRKFASLIGTTEQSINRYLHGTREPKLSTIGKMAKALDVSCDYLILGYGYYRR